MSDKEFLLEMYHKIGKDNLKRLLLLGSEKCISDLDLATSENCKQAPICDNEVCIDCLLSTLEDLSLNNKGFTRWVNIFK